MTYTDVFASIYFIDRRFIHTGTAYVLIVFNNIHYFVHSLSIMDAFFLAISRSPLSLLNRNHRKMSTFWALESPRLNLSTFRKCGHTERRHTKHCHEQTNKLFHLELLF